jgi:hypothetical protein
MTIQVTPIPRLTSLVAPAFTLGTANAAGDAITAVASNSTLLTFDGVAPAQVSTAGAVGSATVAPRRDHVHQGTSAATQAEQETGSSTTVMVTPGRQQYHPSANKWWAKWDDSSTTPAASYNVTSVSDDGTGDSTVTIATDFSSGNWMATAMFNESSGGQIMLLGAQAAGTQRYLCKNLSGTISARDPSSFYGGGWGDQ